MRTRLLNAVLWAALLAPAVGAAQVPAAPGAAC